MDFVCPNSNEEVIATILKIGESISDTELYPYQRPFAEQVVQNLVSGDPSSVTALFSRQCVDMDTLVWTRFGYKKARELEEGDIVLTVENEQLVEDKVTSVVFNPPTTRYKFKLGYEVEMVCDAEQRFRDINGHWSYIGMFDTKEPKFPARFFVEAPLLGITNSITSEGFDEELGIAKGSHLFPRIHYNKQVDRDNALPILTMMFGKEVRVGLISNLLGPSFSTLFTNENVARLIAQHFNAPVTPHGRDFSFKVDADPEKVYLNAAYQYRRTSMEIFCSNGDVKCARVKKTRQFKIVVPITSADKYYDNLIRFLTSMGLNPRLETFDSGSKYLVFDDYQSLYILAEFFEHHYLYGDLLTHLHKFNNIKGTYFSANQVKQVFALAPEVEDYVRKMHRKAYWDYVRDGMLVPKLMDFMKKIAPDKMHVLPNTHYIRVSEVTRLDEGITVAVETLHSHKFVAEGVVAHNCGKSEAVAILAIGCIVWLPAMAKEYPADVRFKKFKRGCWIGIFAPIIFQARSLFKRIRGRMKSNVAKQILHELDIRIISDKSEHLELSNGSFVFCRPAGENANIESQTLHLGVVDEAQDVSSYKIRKSIVPMMTMTGGMLLMTGTANTQKSSFYETIELNKKLGKNHFQVDWTVPAALVPEYKQSVEKAILEIGESSDEFQMAYCNKFIFSRGMMVDPEAMDMYHPIDNPKGILYPYETVDSYEGRNYVVMGIDIGKKNDSTVLTALEVYVDRPIDTLNYKTYFKKILGWKEMLGDDIDTQVDAILKYIFEMRAKTVVIDSTGKGENFYEKIAAALPGMNVIPYRFSRPSKSILYKNFMSDISSRRIFVPAGQQTRQTKEFYKFIKEMSEMEKEYYGQHVDCRAPNVKNAHDDYPTSAALAAYGARDSVIGVVEITTNPFYRR